MTDENKPQADANPTGTPPENNGGNGQQQQTNQQADPAFLAERLERAKRIERETFLRELGFEKPEDLKAIIEAERKRKESDMTETQKAAAEAERLRKENATLQEQVKNAEKARREDQVQNAIRAAATAAKAQYPDDVIEYARKLNSNLDSLIGDDGKVDQKAVEKLIEGTKKDRPTWFGGSNPGSPSASNGKPADLDAERKKKALGERKHFTL